jgi:XTP/dITP diphosphohydrolase
MRICFATNNIHKLKEVQGLIGDRFQVVSLKEIGCEEELAEDGDTIEANSFQKAAYVSKKYDLPCFADDTALEVEALNGAPGVYSARYAGLRRGDEDNMDLLLKNLEGALSRKAQFRTIITFVESGCSRQFEGMVKGVILKEKKGTGGFGYDPLFLPDGYSATLAEMSPEEKNKISHRARAVKKLVEFLKERDLSQPNPV